MIDNAPIDNYSFEVDLDIGGSTGISPNEWRHIGIEIDKNWHMQGYLGGLIASTYDINLFTSDQKSYDFNVKYLAIG